jgi:acyl carrier protein
MEEFSAKLAEILEVDDVAEDASLASYPAFDSLGVLSVIAMIDSLFHINLTSTDLAGTKTVDELWKMVQARRRD